MTEKNDKEKTKKKNISKNVNDPEVGQPRNALPRGQSIEGYETTPPGSRKIKAMWIIEIILQYKKENARKQSKLKSRKTKTKQDYMHSINFIESNDKVALYYTRLKCLWSEK